jgi:glycosyltransferase involved in cell wall biosynthesis
MNITLSLAMVVSDAEATLRTVLADVRGIYDELVIVDTGSTDETIAVAEDAGAFVVSLGWREDLAHARNASFDLCSGDWILWLDADDRVPLSAARELRVLKHGLAGRTDIDAVVAPYLVTFSPEAPNVCTSSQLRERLLRQRAGLRWKGAVDEAIAVPPGRAMCTSSLWVEHRPVRPAAAVAGLDVAEAAAP